MKDARPRYHHGALASALLAEAVTQVRARGVDQVSLRGLAQQVGVSPSAAYQHFPDKAALLVAVGGWAFAELARRMREAMALVEEEGDVGAVARFAAMGRAYVGFAVDEPHLFRHMFGALLAQRADSDPAADGVPGAPAAEDDPHALLLLCLADLGRRGLLRPGAEGGGSLDVLTWSMIHGFSALVVEGHLPIEAGEPLVALFRRLVLTVDLPRTAS